MSMLYLMMVLIFSIRSEDIFLSFFVGCSCWVSILAYPTCLRLKSFVAVCCYIRTKKIDYELILAYICSWLIISHFCSDKCGCQLPKRCNVLLCTVCNVNLSSRLQIIPCVDLHHWEFKIDHRVCKTVSQHLKSW